MKPPSHAPKGAKFQREYKRSREAFESRDASNAKAVLNTLQGIYPVAFESPENRARILEAFPPQGPASLYELNLMRLHRRSRARKIAVCCMPKSGSTFIALGIQRMSQGKMNLAHLHTPYNNIDFVAGLSREQEIDELALLILETRQVNWVSHMHTKWTPYTETVFRAYGIRPIVTQRNIFDCLVSMDDMLMKRQVDGFPMVRLPKGYHGMETADRLSFLTQYAGPWYIDFVVSWSRCRLKTLTLNYDRDVIGFDADTARALRDHCGFDIEIEEVMRAFELDEDGRKSARFNKGVSGRGETVPQAARDHLRRLADVYRDEVDFTGLL